MIIRDDVDTFEKDREQVREQIIWNGSNSITIGARPENTTDAEYLEMEVIHHYTYSEWRSLSAILNKFKGDLFYTPHRVLAGRDSIEEMKVTLLGKPDIEEVLRAVEGGGLGLQVKLVFQEVLQ